MFLRPSRRVASRCFALLRVASRCFALLRDQGQVGRRALQPSLRIARDAEGPHVIDREKRPTGISLAGNYCVSCQF